MLSRYGDCLRSGWPGFYSLQCKDFLFTASKLNCGPTQPPIEFVSHAISLGWEEKGSSRVEVKKVEALPLLNLCPCAV
jgi:hypothetical protein